MSDINVSLGLDTANAKRNLTNFTKGLNAFVLAAEKADVAINGLNTKLRNKASESRIVSTQQLASALKNASTASDSLNRSLDKAKRTTQNHVQTSTVLNDTLTTSVGLWGAMHRAIGAIIGIGLGAKIFSMISDLEALDAALDSVGGGSQAAAEDMAYLSYLGDKLGFTVRTLGDGFKNYKAAAQIVGFSSQEIRNQFESIVQSSRVLNLSMDDTKGTLRALSQIMNKGKVQSEELRGQLGERLAGAYQLAAKAMNLTTEELSKQLELGNVLSRDFIPKFTKALPEAFKLTEKSLNTLRANTGKLSKALEDTVKLLGDSGLTSALSNTVALIDEIVRSLNSAFASGTMTSTLSAWGSAWQRLFSETFGELTIDLEDSFGFAGYLFGTALPSLISDAFLQLPQNLKYAFQALFIEVDGFFQKLDAKNANALENAAKGLSGRTTIKDRLNTVNEQLDAAQKLKKSAALRLDANAAEDYAKALKTIKSLSEEIGELHQRILIGDEKLSDTGFQNLEIEKQIASAKKDALFDRDASLKTMQDEIDAAKKLSEQYVKQKDARLATIAAGINKGFGGGEVGISADAIKKIDRAYEGLLKTLRPLRALEKQYAEDSQTLADSYTAGRISLSALVSDFSKLTSQYNRAKNELKGLNVGIKESEDNVLLLSKAYERGRDSIGEAVEEAKSSIDAFFPKEAKVKAVIKQIENLKIALRSGLVDENTAKSVIDALSYSLSDYAIPLEKLRGFADSLTDAVRVSFATSDWSNIGQSVGSSFADGLGTIVTTKLTSVFSSLFKGSSSVIGGALAGILGGIGGAAVSGLIEGIISGSLFGGDVEDPTEKLQARAGTGTVLGSIDEKSKSIANATALTAHATENLVAINRSMLEALKGLKNDIRGAVGLIARDSNGAAITAPKVKEDFFDNIALGGALNAGSLDKILALFTQTLFLGLGKVIGKALGGRSEKIDEGIKILGANINELTTDAIAQAFVTYKVKKNVLDDYDKKTKTALLDEGVTKQIEAVFQGIVETVSSAASVLGMLPDAISKQLEQVFIETQMISLEKLNAGEQQEALEAVFSKIFDQVAEGVVPFLADFQRAGESLGDTLARVATQVQVTEEAVRRIGFGFNVIGTRETALAAEVLVDAAGGIEAFVSSLESFMSNFASEARVFEVLNSDITRALAQQNLQLPLTRQGYFDLVQAQDGATDSGAQNIATLLRLQGVADDYYTALEQLAETQAEAALSRIDSTSEAVARRLAESFNSAFNVSNNTSSLSRANEILEANVAIYNQMATAYKAGTGTLENYIQSIEQMGQSYLDVQTLRKSQLDEELNLLQELERRIVSVSTTLQDFVSGLDGIGVQAGNAQQELFSIIDSYVNGINLTREEQLNLIEDFGSQLSKTLNLTLSAISGQATNDRNSVKKDIAARKTALQQQIDLAKQSESAIASSIKATQAAGEKMFEAFMDAANSISEYLASLQLSDLSTLTNRGRLDFAESQFSSTLASANAGDVEAAKKLPEVANDFLKEARSFFASSSDYTDIFNRVNSELGGSVINLTGQADAQSIATNATVAAITASGALTSNSVASLEAKLAALSAEEDSRLAKIDALEVEQTEAVKAIAKNLGVLGLGELEKIGSAVSQDLKVTDAALNKIEMESRDALVGINTLLNLAPGFFDGLTSRQEQATAIQTDLITASQTRSDKDVVSSVEGLGATIESLITTFQKDVEDANQRAAIAQQNANKIASELAATRKAQEASARVLQDIEQRMAGGGGGVNTKTDSYALGTV